MKLNLGSGTAQPLEGYANLDGKFGDSLFPLIYGKRVTPNEDRCILAADNSADEIRASHILEHYSHHQTLDVLREWVRVLKPGGWLKIAVPNFQEIAKMVLGQSELDHRLARNWPLYAMGGQTDENDFHKATFTFADLSHQLKEVGLVNIGLWTSEIQDCASLPVSLNLMGQKPEVDSPGSRVSVYKCKHGNPWYSNFGVPSPCCMCCGVQLAIQKPGYCLKCLYIESEREPKVDNLLAAAKRIAPTSRVQVFASGRWQDLDGEVQCATQEEVDAANAGQLQTRTIVVGDRRVARIALCLSTPRIGFLRPLERLLGVMHGAGVSIFSGDGVFWHHALSRSIKNACEFYFESDGEGFDFILTADYDTYALPEDLKALAELLGRSPQADCIVPMQMKRGGTGEILAGGSNLNLTQSLVPIETGHFGFTLFRKEFFEKMPLPWFSEKPDVDGHWGEGRVDADISFWLSAKKAKLNVMLAPGIVVGHGEELITYPRIVNGKPTKVYQAVNDWLSAKVKPEGIGVQPPPIICEHCGNAARMLRNGKCGRCGDFNEGDVLRESARRDHGLD